MSQISRTHEDLWAAVETAGRFDPTVKLDRRAFPKMLRRYVAPMPYTRASLFGRMLAGEPSVLSGFPKPLQGPLRDLAPAEAGRALMSWFASQRSREPHRVFTGPTGVRRHLTLRDIALKWRANRTRFGVTDLHIRGTAMEDVIAPDVLSHFNVLPHSTVGATEQEMFSFVISTRGHVTDFALRRSRQHEFQLHRQEAVASLGYLRGREARSTGRRARGHIPAGALRHGGVALAAQRALVPRQFRRDAVPAGASHPQGHHAGVLHRRRRFLHRAAEQPAPALALDRPRPAVVEAGFDGISRRTPGRDRSVRARHRPPFAKGPADGASAMGIRLSRPVGGALHRQLPRASGCACSGRIRGFAASPMLFQRHGRPADRPDRTSGRTVDWTRRRESRPANGCAAGRCSSR